MNDISLHILDLLQNSVTAGASEICLRVAEDLPEDTLKLVIEDNGKGMSREVLAKVTDPFYTSRTTRRVGMGIPLFMQTVKESGGEISIESEEGRGTKLTAVMIHSHIDRPPLGDVANVLVLTMASNPSVHFIFSYIYNKDEFLFDSAEVFEILGDIPINTPQVIKFLNEYIGNAINEMRIAH
jgi:anti-sigma regulatory factor (Ser/Thr protein kinase)